MSTTTYRKLDSKYFMSRPSASVQLLFHDGLCVCQQQHTCKHSSKYLTSHPPLQLLCQSFSQSVSESSCVGHIVTSSMIIWPTNLMLNFSYVSGDTTQYVWNHNADSQAGTQAALILTGVLQTRIYYWYHNQRDNKFIILGSLRWLHSRLNSTYNHTFNQKLELWILLHTTWPDKA